ncbi:MAG: hypothetical protein MUO31_05465 [Thermodesulfovibrionales bacterium]|nr:hypothetical protein [Thermodesulfovibrionales bacterium]
MLSNEQSQTIAKFLSVIVPSFHTETNEARHWQITAESPYRMLVEYQSGATGLSLVCHGKPLLDITVYREYPVKSCTSVYPSSRTHRQTFQFALLDQPQTIKIIVYDQFKSKLVKKGIKYELVCYPSLQNGYISMRWPFGVGIRVSWYGHIIMSTDEIKKSIRDQVKFGVVNPILAAYATSFENQLSLKLVWDSMITDGNFYTYYESASKFQLKDTQNFNFNYKFGDLVDESLLNVKFE